MSLPTVRLATVALLALAVVAACGRTHPPATDAETAYAAFRDAYAEAATPADKVALAETYLADHPGSERAATVLDYAVHHLRRDLGDLPRAKALVERTLARATEPESRFEMKLTLWEVTNDLGQAVDLRTVATEIAAERALRYDELERLHDAAVRSERWDLADEWATASLGRATVEAYRRENPDSTASDDVVAARVERRRAQALAGQGWARFNLGREEEALATFEAARAITRTNFVGVPQTPLFRYWGLAELRRGDLARAEELLAPDAVMAGNGEALDALRLLHARRTGGEAGFDELLLATRQRLARPAADFTLPTYAGEPVSLASRRGKVVLLAFWFPT